MSSVILASKTWNSTDFATMPSVLKSRPIVDAAHRLLFAQLQ